MMRLAIVILAALSVTGCASSTRFAPAPPQAQTTPQQPRADQHRDLGGPYTREREDREFGRQP
jgi:uncharacterized lipoprotein YbaY